MKLIAHIDLNAFFAQVEELKNPSLVGHPLGVGGRSSRSVLSTANYAARAFGVYSGQPISEARRLCPQLIVVDGHYRDYSEYSHRFMNFLSQRYSKMEQASIDECYIDMTDHFPAEHAHDYLRDLQLELFKRTRLKCSIGLGENRFLAKIGSDYQKPLGLTIILKKDVKKILWPLPIEKMYGIGKKTHPRLKALGIETIGDLAVSADPRVKKLLGSNFEEFISHANGEGNSVVDSSPFDPKSISSARTFDHDTTEYEELKNMIVYLCRSIAKELQDYQKTTDTIAITFRSAEFVTSSKRMKFPSFSNSVADITARALQVFDRYYDDTPLRLIGVAAVDISDIDQIQEQLNLLSLKEESTPAIDGLIQAINQNLGQEVLKKAAVARKKKVSADHSRFHIPDNKDETER